MTRCFAALELTAATRDCNSATRRSSRTTSVSVSWSLVWVNSRRLAVTGTIGKSADDLRDDPSGVGPGCALAAGLNGAGQRRRERRASIIPLWPQQKQVTDRQ
jgi:hypothetical protein